MRKLLLFFILFISVIMLYNVFTDPQKRAKVLGALERSTGVDLEADPEKLLGDAGRALGKAARKLEKDFTDPKFRHALERWGRNALNELDDKALEALRRELEEESWNPTRGYDRILEGYLGSLEDS